jgi:tetratricopeptide (TPR) repeat protein
VISAAGSTACPWRACRARCAARGVHRLEAAGGGGRESPAGTGRFAETRSGEAELRLAAAIWEFWFSQGRWEESRRTLARALATDSGATEARVKALRGLAWITGRLGELDAAVSRGEEALGIARELGDSVLISQILRNLAVFENWRPNPVPERVNALIEESARLARAGGDLGGLRAIANNQSILKRDAGDYRGAVDLAEHAVALSRQAGDRRGLSIALKALGEAEWSLGDRARARACLVRACRWLATLASVRCWSR